MKIYNSILEIQNSHKGFILDIFGVLHASGVPYPNVINSLKSLKESGKKVFLLSNAPRRAETVKNYLTSTVGISPNLYNKILTSGEVFFLELLKKSGSKVLYIGPEKDLSLLLGADVKVVQNPEEEFDFAVITGIPNEGSKALQILKSQNKILFCINPDIFIVKNNGEHEECAGFFAKKYEAMGGKVIYFGKPYGEVYTHVLEFFADFKKNEILAVGDGMETDILGGKNAGIKTCLCLSGLPSREPNLENFINSSEVKPDYIIKAL